MEKQSNMCTIKTTLGARKSGRYSEGLPKKDIYVKNIMHNKQLEAHAVSKNC
jgi:hypothetical protein